MCVLGIEQTFRDHLQKLREQLETITQQPSVGDEERGQEEEGEGTDVAALQIKLSDYRDIIGRQEEMLKVCTHTHTHAPPSILSVIYSGFGAECPDGLGWNHCQLPQTLTHSTLSQWSLP